MTREEWLRLSAALGVGSILPSELLAKLSTSGELQRADFGNTFVWGTAAAAYQIEGASTFQIDACYQLGARAVTNFTGGGYMIMNPNFATADRQSFGFAATIKGLAAGTYNVRWCIYNNGTLALNFNDYVNFVHGG